ncbi:isoleucine--tRNA ligase [Candidatus Saccharibacteria bacterium]|nr:isoleucine--tRNA ligase [Candidatus Saccharibacteria bacterium]
MEYAERRRALEYEKALVEFWKKNKVFEKSIEQRPIENSYVFYDGPPFITGMPHHGTLLSSIVKDAVPRFWTMRGYRVERRWGWDCHGLPAENFVEKQLGITDRREIGTKWSLEDYIIKARESMVANSETWRATIDRIGRWVDFDDAYRTMNKDFMESVWWAFKTLYEAGKIYEGRKVLMYDTKFATPVSKAEVTMDNDAYQIVTDPSAFVKFSLSPASASLADALLARRTLSTSRSGAPAASHKLDDKKNYDQQAKLSKLENRTKADRLYLMAWTTTPWTLPANRMLAVSPKMKYGIYEVNGSFYILAEKLAEKALGEDYSKPVATVLGKELAGLTYKDLMGEGEHKVYAADFVGEEEGTGIVHIAPAYGEDDYNLYLEHEKEAEFADVLDENGYYLPEVAEKLHELGVRDTDENGIEIWAGNKFIAKVLEEKGIVYRIEYIKHEYPFNPRSKQRIMYRAFPSWFFDVAGSKELMLEQNENINWFPGYLKHGRFAKNIEAAPDWNLSRDRFWATAMPVWKGDKGTVKVVGSYDELYELSGVRLEDYHRPWVDEIEFDIDGEHFKRIEKVLDCWFESGSMPFAQLHYPFENKEKFEKNYPADFIVEYVGQVRAWFYYVHVVNTALADVLGWSSASSKLNPYKNVIVTGTLAGNDGRKMSKSLGNYTDPNELMDKYSADSLRFLLLSSPVLAGEDFALLDKDVSDVARKLSGIWNVYDFFRTYANIDKWSAFSSASASSADALLLRRMSNTAQSATPASSHKLDEKADYTDWSNILDIWIISRVHQLRNEITEGMEEYNIPKALDEVLPFIDDLSNWFVRRSRRRFWKSEDDADKEEAYATLYYVLLYLSKILAPFVPFLAEELYQHLVYNQSSASSEGALLAQRTLSTSRSGAPSSSHLTDSKQDVQSIHLLDWPEAGEINEEVVSEMARTREIISEGLALRMNKTADEPQVKVRQPLSKFVYAGEELPAEYEKMILDELNVKEVKNGKETSLDKTITPELAAEGFAREVIRAVQSARKKAGLLVDDRIKLYISEPISQKYLEIVKNEVLADEIVSSGNFVYDEIVKINDKQITISLEKA